jgi:hypothetical protein
VALIGDSLNQSGTAGGPANARAVHFLLCGHQVGARFQTPRKPDTDNPAPPLDWLIRSMKPGKVVYLGNGTVEHKPAHIKPTC